MTRDVDAGAVERCPLPLCKECGDTFTPTPDYSTFCSSECSIEHCRKEKCPACFPGRPTTELGQHIFDLERDYQFPFKFVDAGEGRIEGQRACLLSAGERGSIFSGGDCAGRIDREEAERVVALLNATPALLAERDAMVEAIRFALDHAHDLPRYLKANGHPAIGAVVARVLVRLGNSIQTKVST